MRFRLLGPMEVKTASGWTGIGAPKWRAVLACLLLRAGEVVATDTLVDELWGDAPPARAANLVSVYVLRLRRLIGDSQGRVITTRAPGYLLRLAPDELDTARFETLVRAGRQALDDGDPGRAATLLGEALGLWRGRALADVPASPLVTAETERLDELRLVATELQITAQLACGTHTDPVPELRRLVADHPLREGLWLLLLRALDGAGRRAEALEAYGQARAVIADQLGVDPGPPLRAFFERLLKEDTPVEAATTVDAVTGRVRDTERSPRPAGSTADSPPPDPRPTPRQLPADLVDFTGRDHHARLLVDLLSPGNDHDSPGAVPVAVVAGPGGVGKTTLAVHAAHRLRAHYPDGQLYVNLLGASPAPLAPVAVLGRFLSDLGVPDRRIPPGTEERAALYRSQLADRRVLVVLDDAADTAQVRSLLPGTASCAVLVTSRSRLSDLSGARLLALDVLDAQEARTLLGRIVGDQRLADDPQATTELLDCCAGLPLAIRICGARLAARSGWTVRTLADRLRDERRRLDELATGDLAVRASFEVSFAALPPTAPTPARSDRARTGSGGRRQGVPPARAFRLLGLWQGPSIAVDAAAALLGHPEDEVAAALEVLVDAHLLESSAPDRYRFHDLLRVYAADRAHADEPEPTRTAAIRSLLTWYLHSAEAAAAVISPYHRRVPLPPAPPTVRPRTFNTLDEALDWCETERHALLAATRQAAADGLHDLAWKLPAAAMSFYYRRSHWSDWTTTHQIGLASARTLGDRRAEAWMLNNLGMVYGVQRRDESVACFERALALYRELGDAQGEAKTANNLANAYFDLRCYPQALEAARRSLALHRHGTARYSEGIALGILGGACRELGRYDEAVHHLRRALAIFRDLGDRDAESDVLNDLGEVHLLRGQVDEAHQRLRESLTIRRRIGDRHGEAVTLRYLGAARQAAGDREEATALLSAALRIFQDLGDDAQAAQTDAALATLSAAAQPDPRVAR